MKNQAACRLHALLTELIAGGLASEMTVTKANLLLEEVDVTDQVTRQRVVIATELVDDITRLETQMRTSKQRIRLGVAASGTSLIEITGIGPIGAAIILGSVADIARFPTAGHFASYNATAPVEASSGNKTRHRLNPRGNRKLNHALHIAAILPTPIPRRRPRLLPEEDHRRQNLQRSDPGTETEDLQPGLPAAPSRRQTQHQLNEWWVREDTQGRLLIPAWPAHTLIHRHFG